VRPGPARLLPLAVLPILGGCLARFDPDETPWCLQAVPLRGGRLFPQGVWEKEEGNRTKRTYLPFAREGRRIGLALARFPGGEILVADVVPGGPAARAGFRPGQVLLCRGRDLKALLERMAARPGRWRVRRGKETRLLFLSPVENIRGRSDLALPLLFSFSGDDSFLRLELFLSFLSFETRWEERGPGLLERRVTFSLFWGLLGL